MLRGLQQDGEAEEDAAEDGGHAQTRAGHEGGWCSTASRGRGGSLPTEPSDGNLACSRGTTGRGRTVDQGREGGITQEGVFRGADVVGAALVGASVVTVAGFDALVAPLLADEKGQRLHVLRDVGGHAVLADAAVGQGIGVAFVVLSGHGGDARLLEADERALGLVLVTPVIPVGLGDGVWVDGVGVVELGGALSSAEASKGGNAEGDDGTHGDG